MTIDVPIKTTVVNVDKDVAARLEMLASRVDRCLQISSYRPAYVDQGAAFYHRFLECIEIAMKKTYIARIHKWDTAYDQGPTRLATAHFSFELTPQGGATVEISSEEEHHGRCIAIILSNLIGEDFAEEYFGLADRCVRHSYDGRYIKSAEELILFECIGGKFDDPIHEFPAIIDRYRESSYEYSMYHGSISDTIENLKRELALVESLKEKFQ